MVLNMHDLYLQTETWGLDMWDQLDIRRDLFGNYSTYLFRDRAKSIIQQHDTTKVPKP